MTRKEWMAGLAALTLMLGGVSGATAQEKAGDASPASQARAPAADQASAQATTTDVPRDRLRLDDEPAPGGRASTGAKDGQGSGAAGRSHERNHTRLSHITVDGRLSGDQGTRSRVASLTEALERVADGGRITVLPLAPADNRGFYQESLTITRPVTISGQIYAPMADTGMADTGPDGMDDQDADMPLPPPPARVAVEARTGEACVTINTSGTVVLENIDWIIPAEDYPGSAPCIAVFSGRLELRNNYITGRTEGAAVYIASNEALISDNEITLAQTGVLVEIAPLERRRRARNVPRIYEVSDNTIYETFNGIVVTGSDLLDSTVLDPEIMVVGNLVSQNDGSGLIVRDVQDLTVSSNQFSNNGADGVVLERSGGRFNGNTIAQSGNNGVVLDDPDGPVFEGNEILDSGRNGVRLRNGGFGRFQQNRISGEGSCISPRRYSDVLEFDQRASCVEL